MKSTVTACFLINYSKINGRTGLRFLFGHMALRSTKLDPVLERMHNAKFGPVLSIKKVQLRQVYDDN